jgi:outer membrane receptor protein involved in Fe transport
MKRLTLVIVALALVALPAIAQTPTGILTGTVTDGTSPLPGVTITATSPRLQGTRVAVSQSNGTYIMPLLPPGEYTVTFELMGFQTVTTQVKVSAAQTQALDAVMPAGTVAEAITVTGNLENISTGTQASTTYDSTFTDQLPVPRTLDAAVALSPGVHTTGPNNGITISGAQSFENLFMVNGVVVNENIRGQDTPLYIEDAIQETTTTTAGVSAEYGRFAGGVVNMLTKSGGNEFHGSFRTSFDNASWTAPWPEVRGTTQDRPDVTNKTYEATFGGYILKDKLWFFGAGRKLTTTGSQVTAVTGIHVPTGLDEKRWEGKLTISPTVNHRIVGSYIKRDRSWQNYVFLPASYPPVDLDQFYDRSIPETLTAINYSGIFGSNFFLEGQYSKRTLEFVDSGGRSRDLIAGTTVMDYSNYYLGNAAVFCGVCPTEKRDNKDYLLKASYFLPTSAHGSHDIVVGVDQYEDMVRSDNHQSGSDWWIYTPAFGFEGDTWYPIFYDDGSVFIDWWPILSPSKGSNFKVKSAFVNDKWQLNENFSFNIGVRYDKNHGTTAAGDVVARDSRFSPRLGMSWDPKANGDLVLNASYAHYVTSLANTSNVADQSPAGAPADFEWLYLGPAINTGSGPYLTPHEAITELFNWFNSQYCNSEGQCGSANLDNLVYFDIPGRNTLVDKNLNSPYAEEISVGVSKRLGTRGLFRADYTHRRFKDLYETHLDLGTGTVVISALGIDWGTQDLGYVRNSSYLDRRYDGVTLQTNYRFTDRITAGGNYTWSHAYGNFNGETSGSGPVTGSNNPSYYPEYRDVAWSNPRGELAIDQRHKLRVWGIWDILAGKHNRLSVSLLQNYYSGSPYSASGAVYSRYYVTNPGYITPPNNVTYFYSTRGAYHTDATYPTDIRLNYSFRFNLLGGSVDIFLLPEVTNVLNQKRVTNPNITVYDYTSGTGRAKGLVSFNPFTTQPTECPQGQSDCSGYNWQKGPYFGEATRPTDYQTPRTYRFSVGFRF